MREESVQTQQPFSPQYPTEEDTISLMKILLVLAKPLKLIIITSMYFCVITIIYVLFYAQPRYLSTATFMSSGSDGANQSQMMGLVSQFGFSLPTSVAGLQWSCQEVINSRTMAQSLLMHSFDTEEFGPKKKLLQILSFDGEDPEFGIDTLIINGIVAVQDMIEINTSGSMYELEIFAFEPQLAADMANAVMEELDKHHRKYNSRKLREWILC